ncbi:phosphatidylinositol phosphatase PTPRQ-like isoform X2 [Montipora foliosa]|uniref:phosphatidylinositol phosphatase PTPRQ-like isoform X2 n=1 Tax=Montipora foliosa TaxID=591990 RepID=UPI0035F1F2DD
MPSAPPNSVEGYNTSSKSIFVTWGEVPVSDQNGVILSYTVTYEALPPSPGSKLTKTVNAPNTSITLEDLNEFTDYNLTIFASTVKGGGSISSPITVRTDEDIPSAPPTFVQVYNTSSTSIFVKWEEVPQDDQNGVILSYTATYRALPEPNAPPHNVRKINTSSTSIVVQWDRVPAADQNGVILSYTVSYTALPDGSEKTHNVTAPTTVATLTGLNEYTNYSITVFASTIKGGGIVSQPLIIITDQDIPSAPPNSVQGCNTSSTSIFVSWGEVPVDDQNGVILNYTVTYQALPSGPELTKTVSAATNNTPLEDLSEFTDYNITVFASTIKGGGTISAPITVRTDEDKPSAPPTSIQGFNTSSSSIFVSWGEVPEPDQNGVILSYTVTYQELPSGPKLKKTVSAPTNTITLKHLSEFTDYSITVFASTIKGGGNISSPITVRTDEVTVPEVTISGAPERFTIVGNEIRLTCHYNSSPAASEVQWQKNGRLISRNATMENGARGNITYFSESSIQLTFSQIISTDAANYTCLIIKTFVNSSDTIAIRVKPDPPQSVMITSKTSRTIAISWNSGFDGNSQISSYTVEISEDNQNFGDGYCQGLSNSSCRVSGQITNATLEGLHPGRMYYLRVFANNAVGQSGASSLVNATTDEEVPSAPPNSVEGYNTSSTSIFVSWGEVPVSDQNGVILSYTVIYQALAPSPGSNLTKTVSAPNKSTTLEDLSEFSDYNITVFASTIKGGGNISSPITVRTDEDKPSAPPNSVQGYNTSSTSIFVSWGEVPVADQNGVILSYTVTYQALALSPGLKLTKTVSDPDASTTLEDLSEFSDYNITVFASTSHGGGTISSPITVRTDEDKPNAPPVDVRGRNESSSSILVQWDQVPVADQNGVILSYTVTYRALPGGSKQIEYVIAPTTTATLTGLNEYTNYSITVFASTIKGAGNKSAPIVVITNGDKPNAPPDNVHKYNTSSTSIVVQWDQVPPPDQNGVILSYTVTYRALASMSEKTELVSAPTRAATLTGLNEYTNYSITVFASTSKGDGNKSVPIIVITDEDKPNAPPDNVRKFSTTSTSIVVQWDQVPPADQNGVILSYTVTYRALASMSEKTELVSAPTRAATLTGLNEYTNYSITVFASTSKGGGNKSTPIIVITDEDKPNAPPVNVTKFNTSSTSIVVQWDQVPPADQNGVILSYTVTYRALADMFEKTELVPASTRAATLTGLNEYTNYSITVFSSTIKGGGNKSVPVVVITDEDIPSAPPNELKAVDTTSTSILVQWGDVSASDKNGIVTSFTVRYQAITKRITNATVNTTTVEAPVMHANLTDLIINVKYNISVLASTVKGDGPYSSGIEVTTNQSAPGAPPSNVRGHNTSSTTILVQWDEVPIEKQHGEIISYTVIYWRTKDAGERQEETHVQELEATLQGLEKYTDYNVEVLASTIRGRGPPSHLITVRTDQDAPSASPAITHVMALNSTSILVEWDRVPEEYRNGIITRYTIHYKDVAKKNESTVDTPAPASEITITALRQKALYSIRIRAATSKGDGPWSSATETETPRKCNIINHVVL